MAKPSSPARTGYRLFAALGSAAAALVLSTVYAAAFLLSPFRLGRLLRTVSIPRLTEHKLRTTLTVLGIALGVAVLIAVVIVNRSILQSVTATVDDIAGKTDLQVSSGSSGFDEAIFDAVHAVPGVYKATPMLQQTAIVRDPRAPGERLMLLGVDLLGGDDEHFRTYASAELSAIQKEPLAFLNSPYNIVISRSLAQKLQLRLHDKLALATPEGVKPFDVWGFIENQGVGRAFGGSIAIMYYQAMQVAFTRGHNIDRIDVAVSKREDAPAVAKRLQASLGAAFHVERPERKNDRVAKLLVGLRTGLTMGSMIALLVGVFLIYNTMSISVVQRKREIGILRALGTTRGEVARLLTLEGFLLGTVGSALGIVLGMLLSSGMLATVSHTVSELYLQVSADTVHLDRELMIISFVLGVAGATLASAFPARSAAHQRPVETLRTFSLVTLTPPSLALTKTDVFALLALLAAFPLLHLPPSLPPLLGPVTASTLVLLAGALAMSRLLQVLHRALSPVAGSLLGVEAQLATDNLPRDLGRTAATSGALMVGVAMTMSFAVFVGSLTSSMMEWIDRSIPADLFITAAAKFAGTKSVPMSPALRAELAKIPGVALVERVRVVEMDFRETPVKLLSTDSQIFEQRSKITMLEGSQAEALHAMRNGAVIVSENFSRRFGVHRGDRIELSVKDGTHSFEVAGVDVDYTSDQGTVLMERQVYIGLWADDQVDTYKLYLREGADIEAVRSRIVREHGERFDLFVLTNREFKAEIIKLLDQVFAIMHALEAVALVIAVLGVVNALFASVIDRVREIGVLRALGMRRKQIRKLIVIEGVLVGIAGVLGGTLVGSLTGYILLQHINLVQSGWYFPYRPAWLSAAETALLAVVVSGFAASYPARKAAALVVADALEYE